MSTWMKPWPVILLMPVLVACGRTPTDSAAGSSEPSRSGAARGSDTCTLLTADDIQSVMSKAPGPPRFAQGIQCDWPAADGSTESLVGLIVTGTTFRSYDDYAEAYRRQMNADPAESVRRIDGGPGLFTIGFKDMPMVQIYSGSSMVQVSTFGHEEKHALELARKVVARLD
jgi:hypothetical protein